MEWLLSIFVFLVVFGFLMVMGPPASSYCPDGKRHEWGPWQRPNNVLTNWHKCKKCGYEAPEPY